MAPTFGGPAVSSARAVAVQPQWRVSDYRSEASFRAWMRGQLEAARPYLSPDKPNLVVLTELNGLPLLLRGAALAARAPSFTAALGLTLLRHLPAAAWLAWRGRVRLVRGLQLALAPSTARVYLSVCRDLAREYGVYLACGSAPLPHFERRAGRLAISGGAVYNQAVILGPDGGLIGTADKVYLTPDEGPQALDLSAGRLGDLRVFPTPVGDLGVATSLDAFKGDVIARLDDLGATVLLQPDANGAVWTDKEQLPSNPSEARDQPLAWLDSAWAAVQRAHTIRYAINPMVVGNLFDLAFDGQSAIVARSAEAPSPKGYVLTEPRPGFLALAPWAVEGGAGRLRQAGRELAPHSGSPRENRYRTAVLAADLHLPPSSAQRRALRPHEAALQAFLSGEATLRPELGVAVLGALWPALWAGVACCGLVLLTRQRSPAILHHASLAGRRTRAPGFWLNLKLSSKMGGWPSG